MSNEDMASRLQVYLKKIEKIRVKRMKRENFLSSFLTSVDSGDLADWVVFFDFFI